jgi:cellobiose-specific phosphotransferase system component IIB
MKKVKVFAACALGQSITFFTSKMIEAAKEYDIDLTLEHNTVDEVYSMDLSVYDVILVAPQVRWHSKRIREMVEDKIPVEEISGQVYAIMDGKKGFESYILPHVMDKK